MSRFFFCLHLTFKNTVNDCIFVHINFFFKMKTLFSITFLILSLTNTFSQDKKPYQIFDKNGKTSNYKKLLKKAVTSDIILFGEQHNSAISHWLQYELTADLHKERMIILGAEMFERDNQEVLTQYVKQEIDKKAFDTLARFWSNYKTDYAPLVEFAKENKLEFIATNIPRRYANQVYKQGLASLDSLSTEEKNWIVPLPFPFDSELPTYKEILNMMGDHGTPELVLAQAIKDATMAYSILQSKKENTLFIHYNGAYHSDFYEGILWYLKQDAPDLNYFTISTVTQKEVDKLEAEHIGKADFIIVVDENVTTTY